MAFLDFFKRKPTANESNTLFGQTALGNNVIYSGSNTRPTVNTQILYVTTASANQAGRPIDMSLLTRNSTVMACVGAKARALAQLPIKVMYESEDGSYLDAVKDKSVGVRDKNKAKQVARLLKTEESGHSPRLHVVLSIQTIPSDDLA